MRSSLKKKNAIAQWRSQIEFSITFWNREENLNKMAMLKYFLHKLKLRIF